MSRDFTLGAFGLIFDDQNRILLAHRTDKDMWNLPGGGIEHGEAPWEAVIREIKEETGLQAEVIKLVGVYSKDYTNDIVFSFLCKATNGQLTLSDEADQLEYFSKNEIPDNTHRHHKERVHDYLNQTIDVSLKTQSK